VHATARLHSRGCDTPVVALMARALSSEREKALASGFNGYLINPLSSEILISTLTEILSAKNQ
jgi:CheY-like chemotaxis protein